MRYRFEPEAGEAELSPDEARARGRDYLQEDVSRAASSRFGWSWWSPKTTTPCTTQRLPGPRSASTSTVGRLVLAGPETERERGGDILVFDPTRVTGGIELSDDEILRIRSDAYRVSVTRRA